MRKIITLIAGGMLVCLTTLGQVKTITGTVTNKSGDPVPFVTISIKGSRTGVSADADGKYSISAKPGDILVVSATNVAAQEFKVGEGGSLNLSVNQNQSLMDEVVITTALGLKREKKALGYAAQEVDGKLLNFANNVDVSTALAGKVAGVRMMGSPSSTYDNASIMIRGVQGLGLTPPLYVLDGTPVDQNAVSMENVESVTVLKGAAATALYGQRGGNGVVVMTSKRGKRGQKTSVEVKTGVSFEKVGLMPKYQDQYAGGYTSNATSPGSTYTDNGWYQFAYDPSIHPAEWAAWDGQNILEYGADESWGPKIDGTTMYRPWYSWYPGENFGTQIPLTAQPNNVKNFFETGRTLTNSVGFNASGSNYSFRLTYLNQNRTLILPNSKRQLHQLSLNGAYDLFKGVTLTTDMTYSFDDRFNQPTEDYANDGSNITQNFNQWFQRQLNIAEMKRYREPDGRVNSWNIGDPNGTGDIVAITTPQYWDNPYFVSYEAVRTNKTNRLVGNIGLTVDLLPGLKWYSYIRKSAYNRVWDRNRGTGGLELDYYHNGQQNSNEMNYETNLGYVKKFGNLSVDGYLGGNIRKSLYESNEIQTTGGLSVPNWFNVRASKGTPIYYNDMNRYLVRSLYGKLSLGYKNLLFLDGTLRNDWSSTLPPNNNSYLYYSATGSFVFSDLINGDIRNWLTFGKLRLAYASVGSDISFAEVNTNLTGNPPYAGTPMVTVGSLTTANEIYRAGNIRPALSKSVEAGIELKLFRKLGIDFAVYQNNNTDQIINVSVTPTSGFNSVQTNAGKIQSKGWDLTLTGDIFNDRNKAWQVSFNIARNRTKIVELAPGLNTWVYGSAGSIRLEHQPGKEWGTLIGRKLTVDEKNGLVTIGTNGLSAYTENNELGNVLPDFTGGFVNSFRFRQFDFAFSLDFQKGGYFQSTSRRYMVGAGLAAETVGVNDKGVDIREFPSLGGGVKMVGSDGNGNERVVYIPARRYFYTELQRNSYSYLYGTSYVKLREVRVGYTFAPSVVKYLHLKDLNLSAYVGNAWLIWADTKKFGIDPSELENSWYEGGQLPSTRQFGATLKITL